MTHSLYSSQIEKFRDNFETRRRIEERSIGNFVGINS